MITCYILTKSFKLKKNISDKNNFDLFYIKEFLFFFGIFKKLME